MRRLLGLTALGLSILVVSSALWTAARVLLPREQTPDDADAVVVLAGGLGERLDRGIELVETEVAPVLVLSAPDRYWADSDRLAEICDDASRGFEVVCLSPAAETTAGEAEAISTEAEARGWDTIALVTSDYHLHRATIRFEYCFDGEVIPVSAEGDTKFDFLVHEWLGTLHATFTDRRCGV